MRENIILTKSFDFSVRIVHVYQQLTKDHRQYELSGQILSGGTSIGANVEEAIGGISKKDFIHKMSIAYKEARETGYWIRLLKATGYLDNATAVSLLSDCEEIIKILTSILKSSKNEN